MPRVAAASPGGRKRRGIVVFSSLFPSSTTPNAGLFVRERMFRVRDEFDVTVVSPVPWFPFQSVLRLFKPGFRPAVPAMEIMDGIEVHHPKFISLPGIGKRFDGVSMALCSASLLRRLHAAGRADLIDAHFAYPDGYAASRLGRRLGVPVTVTLRGTEARHAKDPVLGRLLEAGLAAATRVFSVSASLKAIAVEAGVPETKVRVIGNGVDLSKFLPLPREVCRRQLGIADDARVLVSVGGLTERKGFHRVLDLLPALVEREPRLLYLIVGGASAEGDWGPRLRDQVARLGIERHVRFMGALQPAELKVPLSAADVFVLATSNEGWANVFLEAMACGLPVVTTRVGGNAEVVNDPALGILVPFGDPAALEAAIGEAVGRSWDRDAILRYAAENSWDHRIGILKEELRIAMQGVGRTSTAVFGGRALEAPRKSG